MKNETIFSNFWNKLKSKPKFKKIIQSFGLLFSERIIRLAVSFFVTAWTARYLGPGDFGNYTLVVQFVSMFVPVVTFGLEEILAKEFIEKNSNENRILTVSFCLKLLNAFLAFALINTLSHFTFEDSSLRMMVLVFSVTVFAHSLSMFSNWFEARLDYSPLFLFRNIAYFSSIALKIWALVEKQSVLVFVLVFGVDVVLSRTLIAFGYFHKKKKIDWDFDFSYFKTLLRKATPMFLVSILILFEQKVGFVFLKRSHSDELLGNYSLAFNLINIWYFVGNSLLLAIFPSIARSKAVSTKRYKARLQYMFDSMFWLACLGVLGATVLGQFVIPLMFGDKYEEAVGILQAMSFLSVFVFFELARRRWFVLEGFRKQYIAVVSLNFILCVGIQTFLVPAYGPIGVVLSSIISFVLSNLISALFLPKVWKSWRFFLKSIAAPIRLFSSLR